MDSAPQSPPAPRPPPPPRPRSRVLATLRALVKTRVTAGLLTILPIIVTIWLVRLVFGWLRDASIWAVDAFLLSAFGKTILVGWGVRQEDLLARGLAALPEWLQWTISIFSVLLTFFLLYVIGLFTANVIGKRVFNWLEHLVYRVPLVKTIYRTLKQLLNLFSGEEGAGFQRVGLVPFPNELTRSVAFITNALRDVVTGEELYACFIPTTPNPTTGFVFVLRRADVIEVNWTVEEAIKLIMSGGILAPDYLTIVGGLTHAPSAAPGAAGPVTPAPDARAAPR